MHAEHHLSPGETPQMGLQEQQAELAALCSTASFTNLIAGARNLKT